MLALLLLSLVADAPAKRTVVLVAGPKSHGPVGNGIHDYGWSVCLLRTMLETSNVKDRLTVRHYLDGWPRNPDAFKDADAVLVISDGRDGDKYTEAEHLKSPARLAEVEALVKRGCGLGTFHFSTFAPDAAADRILDWTGGFFDWEENGKRKWYSAITTTTAEVKLATADHAIARGLKPFRMREEFYFNIRFHPQAKPIWTVPALGGRPENGNAVAWVRERADGGRGFGTTCGHFYDNWQHEQFRRLMLNAVCWLARIDVPADGVSAEYFTHDAIRAQRGPGVCPSEPQVTSATEKIRVLMVAGNEAHAWHNWKKTTPAIVAALERDPRIKVDVVYNMEELGKRDLKPYGCLVQNYVNWHDPTPLSAKTRTAFLDYLKNGGGLVVVHFANGAFHYSLPNGAGSDWPEYRGVVKRVWNHARMGDKPPSAHDNFARFTVNPVKVDHELTAGLPRFEVTDELYFGQHGDESIDPLLAAESKITKRLEPLAWTSTFGSGRVFQTLLGHSEKTYDAFPAREILRRAVAWAAKKPIVRLNESEEKQR